MRHSGSSSQTRQTEEPTQHIHMLECTYVEPWCDRELVDELTDVTLLPRRHDPELLVLSLAMFLLLNIGDTSGVSSLVTSGVDSGILRSNIKT